MSFFQSEIVQTEMKEIAELQEEIYKNVFSFPSMSNKDKLEHVEMLEDLLKKQQVLYTRLSLSDDSIFQRKICPYVCRKILKTHEIFLRTYDSHNFV